MGCGATGCSMYERPRAPAGCPCRKASERYKQTMRDAFNPWRNAAGDTPGESTGEHDPWKTSLDATDIGGGTSKAGGGSSGGGSGGGTDWAGLLGAAGRAASQVITAARGDTTGGTTGGGDYPSPDTTVPHGDEGYGTDGVMPPRRLQQETASTSSGSGSMMALAVLAGVAALISGAVKL